MKMAGSEMNGDTHGLTATEVQKLSQICLQAKDRAYCESAKPSQELTWVLRKMLDRPIFTL